MHATYVESKTERHNLRNRRYTRNSSPSSAAYFTEGSAFGDMFANEVLLPRDRRERAYVQREHLFLADSGNCHVNQGVIGLGLDLNHSYSVSPAMQGLPMFFGDDHGEGNSARRQ
jgi:hypothetical protein